MDAKNRMVDPSVLKQLAPMQNLSDQHLQELASKTAVETFPQDFILFQQNNIDPWSVYLLDGEIELLNDDKVIDTITANTDVAQHPLSPEQPRTTTARAKTNIHIIRIDSNYLDLLMTWDQFPEDLFDTTDKNYDTDDENAWMVRMLEGEVFRKIPPANIKKLLRRMRDMPVKAGDIIVQEADDKDDYFVIKQGRCEVTRNIDGETTKIAELGVGDGFGEEALLSGEKRSATVTMLTDGALARLSRHNFTILIQDDNVDNQCSYHEASMLLKQGAAWLDVRSPEEYAHTCIPGSINIPLFELRERLNSLDMGRTYIICCDTGKRSITANFLMRQRGFNTAVLINGLNHLSAKILSEIEADTLPDADISRFTHPSKDIETPVENIQDTGTIENTQDTETIDDVQDTETIDDVQDIEAVENIEQSVEETSEIDNSDQEVPKDYYTQAQQELAELKATLAQTQQQLKQAKQLKTSAEQERQQIEQNAQQHDVENLNAAQELQANLELSNDKLQEAIKLRLAVEESRKNAEAEIQRLKQQQQSIEHQHQLTVEQNQLLQEKLEQLESPPAPIITEEIEITAKPRDPIADAETIQLKKPIPLEKPKPKPTINHKKSTYIAAAGSIAALILVGLWLMNKQTTQPDTATNQPVVTAQPKSPPKNNPSPAPTQAPTATLASTTPVPEKPIPETPKTTEASTEIKTYIKKTPPTPPPAVPETKIKTYATDTPPKIEKEPTKPRPKNTSQSTTIQLATHDQRNEYQLHENMTITVAVSQDAYVYCYYQTTQNNIMKIFPNRFKPSALLKANTQQLIPDATMPFKIQFQAYGTEAVQCLAIKDDNVDKLPANFNLPSFEKLPIEQLYKIPEIFQTSGLTVLSTEEITLLISTQ